MPESLSALNEERRSILQDISGELGEKNNYPWRAYGRVLPGKSKCARPTIDAEGRDGVGSLITRVKIVPCGVDIKAARIVTSSPFLAGKRQRPLHADGKPGDAVMQPVGGVNKF